MAGSSCAAAPQESRPLRNRRPWPADRRGNGTWGWDFDGSYGDWYTGHELGHTYGRRHPGFCGESASDLDNYPFANGQLANSNTSFAGFDVGDPTNGLAMAALPGTQWHDVMTYCSFQWLCAYTYLGVRRRLAGEEALPSGPAPGAPGPAPGPSGTGGRPDGRFPRQSEPTTPEVGPAPETVLVSVVTTANLTKREGQIQFVNPLKQGTPTLPSEKTDATLRVKGSRGKVLATYPVEVKLNSELEPGQDREGIVDAVVAVSLAARSIELLIGSKVADAYQVGGGPPAVGRAGRRRRRRQRPWHHRERGGGDSGPPDLLRSGQHRRRSDVADDGCGAGGSVYDAGSQSVPRRCGRTGPGAGDQRLDDLGRGDRVLADLTPEAD